MESETSKIFSDVIIANLENACVLFYKWKKPRKGGYVFEFLHRSGSLITIRSISSKEVFTIKDIELVENFKHAQ